VKKLYLPEGRPNGTHRPKDKETRKWNGKAEFFASIYQTIMKQQIYLIIHFRILSNGISDCFMLYYF
jgi:hypothetical protein